MLNPSVTREIAMIANEVASAGSGTRTIQVDALARVEGEGALYVRVRDKIVEDVKFRIFEPPRFFEALLRGRMYGDAPDITSRICGICPIAYIAGACHAMEMALGADLSTGPLRVLRRLIYCGEWIQSHVLHAYLLHAPDFLGLQDSIQLARLNPPVVEKALRLKKLGNEILEAVGGRSVHPVNCKVGGFYRSPSKTSLHKLIEPLKRSIEDSIDTIRLFSSFTFPEYEDDYTFLALHHPEEYAIDLGRIVSNRGLDIAVPEFLHHIEEEQIEHSTSLHARLRTANGNPVYMVGPLARYALNYRQLTPLCQELAKEAGLGSVERNPFKSLIIRAIETLYACQEALRLVEAYEEPDRPDVPLVPRSGIGHGCTEAPRGLCYHRYELDREGRIVTARIVPPTSQNQKVIEADLLGVVQRNLDLADEDLKWRCEQAIRNYDPCISCSCHFLKLTIERV
jgi:coenzyme F420-reducing hydrogenase alpha subunit